MTEPTENPCLSKELTVHPYAAAFPVLDQERLAELVADLTENGQLEPIILSEDLTTLIDGRNRLRACQVGNIEPIWETLSVVTAMSAVDFIRSKNVHRRHLGPSFRAKLMVLSRQLSDADDRIPIGVDFEAFGDDELPDTTNPETKELIDKAVEASQTAVQTKAEQRGIEKAGKEKPGPGRPSKGKTNQLKADAAAAEVSETTMRRAKHLAKELPDLFARIADENDAHKAADALTVNEAWDIYKAEKSDRERAQAMSKVMELLAGEDKGFVDAVKRGELLKTPDDVRRFSELEDDLRAHIRGLLAQGWNFAKALKYTTGDLEMESTLKELAGKAAAHGGEHAVQIGDFVFECRLVAK